VLIKVIVYSTRKHKIFKNHLLVMIEVVIILKDETLNLQGIGTFSKIHIYSILFLKKIHLRRKLYAFIIKICQNIAQKFIYMKKILLGQMTCGPFLE